MKKLTVDYSKTFINLDEKEILSMQEEINLCHDALHGKTGEGAFFTGWLNLPNEYDKAEMERVKKAAKKIQENSEVLVVIGIGGSYLGAKAAIDILSESFLNDRKGMPEIIFAGNSISSTYLNKVYNYVKDKDFSVNVISKSGTTTEPAIAFRLFKELLEEKYGKNGAKDRIFATTDKSRGALKAMAEKEGYETFIIPDDVGGRYSVLTPVGMLPIAVCGVDIDEIMEGAKAAFNDYLRPDLKSNDCYKYAACRNALYRKGKTTEIMVNYEPSFMFFAEWWKQLYGESEGKGKKGLFPASALFSTDLHSIGQYIQDGLRIMFETVINIDLSEADMSIKEDADNLDNLNYLAGKSIDYINKKAFWGAVLAHNDGGVPAIIINVPQVSPYYFGYMVYFFEKACAISGYMLGVNPFDQPGVEAYKNNMFALLGKPGYENEKEILKKRL
ncbi:MAG: glucose-6-phosphate isomerase [Ruminococcaceae bacterium]|nr:glucose-6-phosphate isomerase [Oscillospiraceae bacterium]